MNTATHTPSLITKHFVVDATKIILGACAAGLVGSAALSLAVLALI